MISNFKIRVIRKQTHYVFRDAALIMKNITPSYFDVFSGGLLSNLTVNTPLALPIGMIIIQLLYNMACYKLGHMQLTGAIGVCYTGWIGGHQVYL